MGAGIAWGAGKGSRATLTKCGVRFRGSVLEAHKSRFSFARFAPAFGEAAERSLFSAGKDRHAASARTARDGEQPLFAPASFSKRKAAGSARLTTGEHRSAAWAGKLRLPSQLPFPLAWESSCLSGIAAGLVGYGDTGQAARHTRLATGERELSLMPAFAFAHRHAAG